MAEPLVTIIVPTYNYGAYVERAVASCLAQTHPALDIVVIDDGSTDDTASVLHRFGERIRLFLQPHAGVSAARNRGLAEARGEFVSFLDADDWLTPDSVALRLAALQAHPDVDVVLTGAWESRPGRERLRPGRLPRRDVCGTDLHEALLLRRLPLFLRTAMVRAPVAHACRFPEAITNGEDIAYLTKLLFRRHALLLAQRAYVVFRHPGSQRSNLALLRAQELALVSAIFDDPAYGGALAPLRTRFTSQRCLSLARRLFRAGDGPAGRAFYLQGLVAWPPALFRLGYLGKYLRSWVRCQPGRCWGRSGT